MGSDGVVRPTARHAQGAMRLLLVLALVGCTAEPGAAPPQPIATPVTVWPGGEWAAATAETEGFDPSRLADGLRSLRETGVPIHSLVVVRHGRIVLDATFYPYDGVTAHDLEGATVGVLTTLVGIAVDRGLLSLDDRLVSFFPDRRIAELDPWKEQITIEHLVSMSSGLDCTAADDEATLQEMLRSPDPVGFALDLPMLEAPGSTFRYCSPGMHLLAAVLQRVTGVTALEFGRQFLFEPLGIEYVRWAADRDGVNHGWGGLALRPADAARLGYLWAARGAWRDRQIVSSAWMDAALARRARRGGMDGFGYGFWLLDGSPVDAFAAVGHGGQRIAVRRSLDLVTVSMGNGVDPDEVANMLGRALVDDGAPLLSDPDGAARLATTIEDVEAAPEARPAARLPGAAGRVDGVSWALDDNNLGIASIRLDFDGRRRADLRLGFADRRTWSGQVGLDGVSRFSGGPNGLPWAVRGGWTSGSVFTLEIDEPAGAEAWELRLTFEDDTLTLEGHARTRETGFVVTGRPVS